MHIFVGKVTKIGNSNYLCIPKGIAELEEVKNSENRWKITIEKHEKEGF